MTTSTVTPGSRADWYSDPTDPGLIRYWDGRSWTFYTLPKPDGWDVGSAGTPVAWWQSWWAVVPGLLLCLPLGLVGLWRRPGVSVWLRVGVTLASLVFFGSVVLSDDNSNQPGNEESSSAANSAAPTPPPSSDPMPEETEPPKSVVPKLTGLSRREAEERLVAVGLVVREVRQIPSPRPRGTVLRHSKKVGASVLTGSEVVLVVAAPYPRVPNVVGRSKSVAMSRLRDAGFRVAVTTEERTSGEDGIVLRQTPAGSDRVKPHSSISVVVSNVVAPPPPPQDCTAGYSPCLAPAYDYDCAGGSGDGPEYAYGPIYVSGSDPYDLDRDGDGVACES